MKFSDKTNLISQMGAVLIALAPTTAYFLRMNDSNEKMVELLILFSATVFIAIVLIFSNLSLKNKARIDGFALGYFYNFIYETAELIFDGKADIKLGEKAEKTIILAAPGSDHTNEYTFDDIKMLIIIPGDLFADYRLAEIISNILVKTTITSDESANRLFPARGKIMKGLEIDNTGRKRFLLLDTPPTTMRSMKLYQESFYGISHNDPVADKEEKLFNKMYRSCKNFAPGFKQSLGEIIASVNQGTKKQSYKDFIKIITIDTLIDGIIRKEEYNSLKLTGDNTGDENKKKRQVVETKVHEQKDNLLRKIGEIMAA